MYKLDEDIGLRSRQSYREHVKGQTVHLTFF